MFHCRTRRRSCRISCPASAVSRAETLRSISCWSAASTSSSEGEGLHRHGSQHHQELFHFLFVSVGHQISNQFKPFSFILCVVYAPSPSLTNTQESLESSLLDKENTLAKTSEKLELISSLGESLSQKELQLREVSEKLLQTELSVSDTLRPRRRCFRHAAFFSFVLCLSRAAGEGLPGRQPLRETVFGAESRGGRPDAQAERAEGESKHL